MPESISSTQPEDSVRSDAILALGRKLVEELGLETSTDTLGRWMSHYLAELIVQAESSIGDEKNTIEKNCFDTILALWKHRAVLHGVGQPFERVGELAQAIESLNPDNSTPRYFRAIRSRIAKNEKMIGGEDWLELADGLDYSAKVLISHCLGNAAREATDKSKEWVSLAEAAGMETKGEKLVVRFVSRVDDFGGSPDASEEERRELEERVERLEGFSKLATRFAAALKKQLGAKPRKKKNQQV